MDFRLLELFLRVAEAGSINRAAAALNLSQPALSRHVAVLEHQMAAQLLVRGRGGVRLTEAGELLCDRARPLLRQFTILKEQVGERAAGQLSVGTPPAWQRSFTAPFAAAVAARHPGVRLRIFEGVSGVLREYVAAGLLDLAILPFDPAPPSGYAQTPLSREPLALVGDAGAGLRAEEPVGLTRLEGRGLVLPGPPNVLRQIVEGALRRDGIRFRVVVEADTLGVCLELARRSIGLTVVPVSSLHQHALGDTISWAPMPDQAVAWALLENEARGHSQAVRQGRKLVLDTVRDHVSAAPAAFQVRFAEGESRSGAPSGRGAARPPLPRTRKQDGS